MEDFCGSKFWDTQLTWNTTDPYFTSCFESIVVEVIPGLFLFLFGFIELLNIKESKTECKTFREVFTPVNCLKVVLTVVLALFQLIEIIRLELGENDKFPMQLFPVDILSPTIQLIAHVTALILLLRTQYNGIESSGVQFFYWLLSTLTQGICFRTAFLNFSNFSDANKEKIIYITTLSSFPIICLRFLVEFINTRTKQTHNEKLKPSPEFGSIFISKLLLLWYDSLVWIGFTRTLTKKDLWDLKPEDTAHSQIEMFSKYWNHKAEKPRKQSSTTKQINNPSVWIPLVKCYGIPFGIAIFIKLSSDMLVFVQPTMLNFLLGHVTNPTDEPTWKGYFYTIVICMTLLVQILLNGASNRRIVSIGLHARAALSNAVYRKSLVISSASRRETSVGEMVNLQSVDSQKIIDLLPFLAMATAGPFQIVICIILLHNTLGPSIFAGVTLFFVLIPLNIFIVTLSRRFQMEQMKFKDERLKITSEILSGIKVLKLYAWELAFQNQIEVVRQREINYLKKIAFLNVIASLVFQCTPVLVSLASFVTYVSSSPDNILFAQKTFVAINLFNIMRFPMIQLPHAVSLSMQTAVSMTRLSKYLNMEELDKCSVTHVESFADPIVMKDATLNWTTEHVPTLKEINFNVKHGELVAVVGAVGSGKSSLLSSLLGDLEKKSGLINTKGDIAYVSQCAWIQNATLRNNILFGDNLNEAKYWKTIHACALHPDLKILVSGDQTEIGEKGINLSGGQKQRIALARAAYKKASVYLFDDPLSAVDSHVAKHIFENLIGNKGILGKKTRILVTHAVSFLPHVDRIYVLKDGQVRESGTYKELMSKHGEFAELLLSHLGSEKDDTVDQDLNLVVEDLETLVGPDVVRRRSSAGNNVTKIHHKPDPVAGAGETRQAPPSSNLVTSDGLDTFPPSSKLISAEVEAKGNIKLSIFVNYFKSAGILLTITCILFCFLAFASIALSNIWLSNWSTQATKDAEETGTSLQETTDKYILGYALIAIGAVFSFFVALVAHALFTLAASRVLHGRALTRILRAPMSYFDTTLLGRIINRFSKDIDTLDNIIPINIRAFLNSSSNVIFSLIVISYTQPIFIGFVMPLVLVYICLQRFYVSSSRQLKRIESVSRSPIFSHFGETISGSSIIRAFRMQEQFIKESEARIDENQKAYFPFLYSTTWVTIRLEFLGFLIILATCLFVLLSRTSIDPGDAGLAISYALQVTTFLSILARQVSDLEANIVAAERVNELTETPQERKWDTCNTILSASWPQNGQIIFEAYMTRYREGLDVVLKGISCKIEPGEKIGVVGRTGAGKSSLTLAIFRIIESSNGRILIDGVDISSLGLHDLRKKITIIPQDPVLFSGSLRLNLDPFNDYSDEQLWQCLDLAHLKGHISTLGNGLYHSIEEEGQNFSVGQRQLICLARALLRKTKILVLDEATAAVDLDTDQLIQATIRREFANCTVLTIAHRLNTIVDSNRVMVLHGGEIKEFDSPQTLLQDKNSIFWGMAKEAKII